MIITTYHDPRRVSAVVHNIARWAGIIPGVVIIATGRISRRRQVLPRDMNTVQSLLPWRLLHSV